MRLYPFTAVVGMAELRLALLLCTISPSIGGVLVRGEKGTAKSTMVRALAGLLPDVDVVDGCRFSCDPAAPDPSCPDGPHRTVPSSRRPARLVELPVGAAEERVVGSLDLERALRDGVTDFQPGLLAGAHRGMLYVDEVNLLHDHLVDTLLDAAAMARVTVEREGASVSHAARFVLIGTMNPEEGELRPQLLDRFGLTVEVSSSRDAAERVEVVRRRLAYESDPDAFAAGYADDDAALAAEIAAARKLLPSVELTDEALLQIAEVCAAFEVDGMRADIVTARTAAAHAAWCGRTTVSTEDIRVASRLALPHRRRRNPFDAPGIDSEQLEQALQDAEPPEQNPDSDDPDDESGGDGSPGGPDDGGPDDGGPDDGGPDDDGPGDGPDDDGPDGGPGGGAPDENPQHGNGNPQHEPRNPQHGDPDAEHGDGAQPHTEQRAGTDTPYRAKLFTVDGAGAGADGRRSRAEGDRGRIVGVRPDGERSGSPHLVATLRAAARQRPQRGPRADGAGPVVLPRDLRFARREGKEGNLVLLCVDSSGSMGSKTRMREVKTAVLSLLLDAYQRRDKVGLVTFRASEAQVALPPTGSVDVAAARLEELPTGGRTPLAEGLTRAAEVLRVEALRDGDRRPLLVVVTDGRATSGPEALQRAHTTADGLARSGVSTVVMDCESGRMRLGLAKTLAGRLGAEHVAVGDVAAEKLTDEVKRRAA
ncbi:putative cobaltochelatase [Prauserella halophila]|uniref:Mg-protoporphyrin IX chelatase n=1 Tax=Prauserella halophila TaxID=185641 RepID=A0ABN1WBF5_9PSEU|nr:magnesium chelatase subunit D family protein [Prauserella halophila]MCP2235163.1 magnesium chelatase subunit D [Prauserella halophila]